jgi:23S rRNA pseudouridine955/2504/2580 synthase
VPELVPIPKHVKVEEAWADTSVLEVSRRTTPEIIAREVFRKARSGDILLNGGRCHPLDRAREGDILTIVSHRPAEPTRSVPTTVDAWVATPNGPFFVVREDPDLLVVSKPSGCASHPALRHSGDTLIERIRSYLGVQTGDTFQPALANRLDIETSGIVLVGKTRRAQRRLGKHFQKGHIRKWYTTLAGGWPQDPEAEVRVPLLRKADSRLRDRFPPGHPRLAPVLQDSITRYRTLCRFDHPLRCALLEVELLTGRTHQIRRHLAAVGHPVAGDHRYGDPEYNRDLKQVCALARMFLHAHRVELVHPATAEPLTLETPLPEDLGTCLASFGAGHG